MRLGLRVRDSTCKGRVAGLLCLCELFKQRLRRVEFKRKGRLADSHCGGLLAHLLPFQVPLQRVEKQAVVRYTVPVEDLLLLLSANAVVLVQKVKKRALGLLQRSISTRLEVSQVGEDAFLELLRVLDRTAKSLEAEGQASYNISTGDVEKIVPASEDTMLVWLIRAGGGSHAGRQGSPAYHRTQDTYSPVGNKNLRMY